MTVNNFSNTKIILRDNVKIKIRMMLTCVHIAFTQNYSAGILQDTVCKSKTGANDKRTFVMK
jgi:hypothetical protein